MKKNQAFRLVKGSTAGTIVEITSWEDLGEYWYISYRPVNWLDGKYINHRSGSFGCIKVFKNGPKPIRLPIYVQEMPSYGVGVRAAFTMKNI